MSEPIHFHTDLYRRDALEVAAQKYKSKARVELVDSGAHVVAHLQPLSEHDAAAVRDDFCTEVFSATARSLRGGGGAETRARESAATASSNPPWEILAPFSEGTELGLGWVLESLSPVRSGAASLVLRHKQNGIARVAIRRNSGAPMGVAHTDSLDFMLMNGGGSTAQTDQTIERILKALASALRSKGKRLSDDVLGALLPHAERVTASNRAQAASTEAVERVVPRINIVDEAIHLEVDETGISRLALYDAVLAFADRCHIFLTRPDANRFVVHIKPRADSSTDTLAALARDIARAVKHVTRQSNGSGRPSAGRDGLPQLSRQHIDIEALLAELDAADPTTLGLGFQSERGPGHENLRVLNLRGTGACNSECVFCIEKFNPSHRPMPRADATRQLILDSAGQYDLLFFASGEPTIHPKLFEYVDLAKSVGFTSFGMSSHFRTFADPRFALKTLQAGFEYFDIALHAADLESQLAVNPIEDEGQSLYEALKGLSNLYRLADTLGIRISITHKIVVSRLNVTQLEPIFRAGYDRGVRHFILQPVRSMGLDPELQAKLEISEEEILPHLNELLRTTQGLGAVVKPYGFSRQNLFSGSHIESESNRVKNIYGKVRGSQGGPTLPAHQDERPTDGRPWVQVNLLPEGSYAFAADRDAPILDIALQRGLGLMFGCRMGSCGMCCARLIEGSVDQSEQIFLTDEQISQGYVLLCQAKPLSDVVVQICSDEEIDRL